MDRTARNDLSYSRERLLKDTRNKLISLERHLKISIHKSESVLKAKKTPKPNAIVDLEKAKQNILAGIQIASNPSYIKEDDMKTRKLEALVASQQKLEEKVQEIIAETKEILGDRRVIYNRFVIINRIAHNKPFSTSKAELIHKIRKLEDSREQVTTITNLNLKRNIQLKGEINELLKIRGAHHEHSLTMHKKISNKRRETAELTKEGNECVDECFDKTRRTKFLRNQNDKRNGDYQMAVWEYEMQILEGTALYKFIQHKLSERSKPLPMKESDRKDQMKTDELEMYDSTIEKYNLSLESVKPFLNEGQDSLEIIHKLEQITLANYSLFRKLTTTNEEIEILMDEIQVLKQQIETESNRKEMYFEGMDENIKHLQATLEHHEEVLVEDSAQAAMYQESSEVLAASIQHIVDLVVVVQENHLLSFLGHKKEKVDPQTVELTFRILEHTIADLLFQKSTLRIRKAVEIRREPLPVVQSVSTTNLGKNLVQKSQGGPYSPHVVVATHRMAEIEIEQDQPDVGGPRVKPKSYREIRDRVLQEFHDDKTEGSSEIPSLMYSTGTK